MALHKISRGLDPPLLGEPEQRIHAARPVSRIALLAGDFQGLKPALRVALGDTVKRGQPLFEDLSKPGVVHTAPGAGRISAINLDANGNFSSIAIDLSNRESPGAIGDDEQQAFAAYAGKPIPALSRDMVRALLLESGLWTAFRTRPFGRTPNPTATPDAIFITAVDTEPLAPKPELVVAQSAEAFDAGLAVLAKLREGAIFLCVAKDSPIKAGPYSGVSIEQFAGPHPAGTPSVHIHTLYPVDRTESAWHIGYQDIIRIGVLFKTGKLDVDQIVALAGPAAKSPRLLRTRLGASIAALTENELAPDDARIFSGSALAGRAISPEATAFLGRFHRQIACMNAESLSALQRAGSGLRRIQGKIAFALPQPLHKILLAGVYRNALPIVRRPASLLGALLAGDAQAAEHLGCLEIDEEDLVLASLVCPGHTDYAPYLRRVLNVLDTN